MNLNKNEYEFLMYLWDKMARRKDVGEDIWEDDSDKLRMICDKLYLQRKQHREHTAQQVAIKRKIRRGYARPKDIQERYDREDMGN